MNKTNIFVISLLHSQDRRVHIRKQMKSNGIQFEFVDAVYGKDIDMQNEPRINYEKVKKYPNWLTPNMIGCGLSHIKVYEKIVEQNLDFAIIFEDDVVLGNDFREILENIPKVIDNNCAMLLYYQSWDIIKLQVKSGKALWGDYNVYEVDGKYRLISTGAYVITKAACKTMLEKTMPLYNAPDSWQFFFDSKAIENIKIVYPLPVSTYEFQSTISSLKEIGTSGWKYKILNLTEKYKIPILYQWLKKRRKANKKSVQKIFLESDL